MAEMFRSFAGKMDMDSSFYRVNPNDYVSALNITRRGEVSNSIGPVSNIRGNRIASFTFPSSTTVPVCIGAKADPLRNRIIEFVWHPNGYHTILSFSTITRVRTKIFQSRTDSAGTDILKLQKLYKVKDIDIIHREEDGDLLFWNDGYNRPGALNIQDLTNGIYGTSVPEYAIRLAKQPPLDALLPVYGSEASPYAGNGGANNLKKKLFQFKYRWVYYNGYKSSWSPISKVKIPVDAYSIDTDTDPTQNNVIYLQVTGGGVDYKAIEIAGRESLGNTWGDFFLIDSLNRVDYGINPGSTYTYKFFNDGAYPKIDVRDSDLLFDRVPDKANAQVLINGNVLGYMGITDGYNPLKRTDVNVQITSSLVASNSSGTEPATPTINVELGKSDARWFLQLYIGVSVGAGSQYRVKFKGPIYNGDDFFVDVTYTANGSDTQSTVAMALNDLIHAQLIAAPTSQSTTQYIAPNKVRVTNNQNIGSGHNYQYEDVVVSATALVLRTGGAPTWKHNAKYRFGLVYFDLYGKTNGVVSFVSNNEDPNDFSVTTPDFRIDEDLFTSETALQPKLPVISAVINHLPPSWAVRYQWVRTENQAVSKFLQYITCQVDSDTNFYYFCIANLDKYKLDNTGFVPSYDFAPGDRMRVMCKVESASSHNYTGFYFADDYEILGVVEKQVGADPETIGRFIKVAIPNSPRAYENNMLIEIYTPALRTNAESQVFWEFGESYPIYTSGGVRYHVGENQNQTASQPATFTFEDGDVYYKFRNFYDNTLSIDGVFQLGVMDANYADFWASAVNSNGRPNIIDPNAKRLHNPVLMMHSQAFQQGTDINGLNRFYPEDFDEYNRKYGDVMKAVARDNAIIVFQKFKVGAVPVDQQMTYNVDGTTNLILSSKLVNKIQYYSGEFGIGDCPDSVAHQNESIYWWDNIRGVACRLAQNGITPISITAKINSFAIPETKLRGFNSKIYGVFDTYRNTYISAFEASGASVAKTIVWNESDPGFNNEGFESFVSYTPEMMCCINNLLVSWKNGQLYTHDDTKYNPSIASGVENCC